ncbi:DUF2231 domain-containing protein [Sphingomonas sp. PB2P19]|uniref:DUF2231 domain-containing protein n=1 Tax=Sphingomonas rhamnosi TaxID=3096156 RepID=UPI002FCC279B
MATVYPTRTVPPRKHGAHPIHGILSAFPLALFTAALVSDIAYVNSAEIQWANFSIWLIAGGLLMGVLAAVAGIVDAVAHRGQGRVRRPWPHSIGTLAMMVLALVNAFVHSRDGWTSVVPAGIILSAIVAILALATSWSGYTLEARQDSN